jgi:hypothetical protein
MPKYLTQTPPNKTNTKGPLEIIWPAASCVSIGDWVGVIMLPFVIASLKNGFKI